MPDSPSRPPLTPDDPGKSGPPLLPEYSGPLPSSEDLDTSCTEVMRSATPTRLLVLADGSDSMRALLFALYDLGKKFDLPKPIANHQAYNLIRGVMIGILAERRRNRGTQ